MLRNTHRIAAAVLAGLITLSSSAHADDAQVARGKYLVGLGGCTDCHTPGYFLGRPDMPRYLAGSDVGFYVPNAGTFVGPNLTPDTETGLGRWSAAQVVKTLRTGVRPDGRVLSPIMPWPAISMLTQTDLEAVVAFLRSLPPVRNKVPGPFAPNQEASVSVMKVVPPKHSEKSMVP